MVDLIGEIKSCWNCFHCKGWSQSETREAPGDSGWECQHQDYKDLWREHEHLPEPEMAVATAAFCPGYQYQAGDPDPEPEDDGADFLWEEYF